MRKNILFIGSLLISSISFAGNGQGNMSVVLGTKYDSSVDSMSVMQSSQGGGGGLRSESIPANGGHELRPNSEIVYSMGQKDGSVKFAYGQFRNGQWQVQHVEVPSHSLTADENSAIEKSAQMNQWIELK